MNSKKQRYIQVLTVVSLIMATLQSLFTASAATPESTNLKVSLLTCYPGAEVFNLCGHSAIRIQSPSEGTDSIWNFGLFDFSAPNFVYRFTKGETDYMVGGEDTDIFIYNYLARGRRVEEQDLNLTPAEAVKLRAELRRLALPKNRVYRYNYVKNNCATRIRDVIEESIDGNIAYPRSVGYGSWRKEMRDFHKNYPWYQMGIDILLGSGIDKPVSAREEMFVPMVMQKQMSNATVSDGRKLVSAEKVLYEGRPDASLPPTPWYLGPLFWSLTALLLAAICIIYEARTHRIVRWANAIWFTLTGLAGTLVCLMVAFSQHEATSPNLLICWLNPVGLLVPLMIWWRKAQSVLRWIMAAIAAAAGMMLVIWPLQIQSTSLALFPLMLISIGLALTYALVEGKKEDKPGGKKAAGKKSTTRNTTSGRRNKKK